MLRRDLRMFLFDSTRTLGGGGDYLHQSKEKLARGKAEEVKSHCISRGVDRKRRGLGAISEINRHGLAL